MTPRARTAAAAATLVLALAGCTAGSTGTATPGTSAPATTVTRTATPSTSASSTAAPSSPSSSASSPPASSAPAGASSSSAAGDAANSGCGNSQLRIAAGEGDGATGHDGFTLTFRNVSHTACTLHGYPGLDVLRTGHPPVHAERTTSGFLGGSKHGVPTVHLRPGHVASAKAEFTFIDDRYPSGDCPGSKRIAVTAANTTRVVHLRATATICNLQIHPTVPGSGGSYGF